MEKRRRGRPAKAEDDRASINFTMRLRPPLFEELQREAEANGRSVSAQVERRLSLSESELLRVVATTVEVAKRYALSSGKDQRAVDDACRRAAHVAIEVAFGRVVGPSDDDIDKLTRNLGQEETNERLSVAFALIDAAESAAGKKLIDRSQ